MVYAYGLVTIESPEVTKARRVWAESRDPAKALEAFPRHRNVEREVLFGLQKHGLSNALAAIQHVRVELVFTLCSLCTVVGVFVVSYSGCVVVKLKTMHTFVRAFVRMYV